MEILHRSTCGTLVRQPDGSYRHFASGEALPSGEMTSVEGVAIPLFRDFYNVRLWRRVESCWVDLGNQAIAMAAPRVEQYQKRRADAAWFPLEFNPNDWEKPVEPYTPKRDRESFKEQVQVQVREKPTIQVEMTAPTQAAETKVVQTSLF